VGKGERAGGKGKTPFFFPRFRTGEGDRGDLSRRRAAAPQGSAAAGGRGKWRGDRGDLNHMLTLGWDCLWRRLRSWEWVAAEVSGGGAIGGGGGARKGCGGVDG
jgi:hypothetical protein